MSFQFRFHSNSAFFLSFLQYSTLSTRLITANVPSRCDCYLLSFCVRLSVCLSVYLSVCLSVCLSVSVCARACVCVCTGFSVHNIRFMLPTTMIDSFLIFAAKTLRKKVSHEIAIENENETENPQRKKQVTRGHNIVADGWWAGAFNP